MNSKIIYQLLFMIENILKMMILILKQQKQDIWKMLKTFCKTYCDQTKTIMSVILYRIDKPRSDDRDYSTASSNCLMLRASAKILKTKCWIWFTNVSRTTITTCWLFSTNKIINMQINWCRTLMSSKKSWKLYFCKITRKSLVH